MLLVTINPYAQSWEYVSRYRQEYRGKYTQQGKRLNISPRKVKRDSMPIITRNRSRGPRLYDRKQWLRDRRRRIYRRNLMEIRNQYDTLFPRQSAMRRF